MSLVTDMHGSADKIIEIFRGMRVDESSSQSIAENPAKLCYVAKQCLREAAIGRYQVTCVHGPILNDCGHFVRGLFV